MAWLAGAAGLGTLILGVTLLARVMSGRARGLSRLTGGSWPAATLAGVLAALALQSSSLTVVLLASAVDGGSLDGPAGWAAVAGVNVGATLLPHVWTWEMPWWCPVGLGVAGVAALAPRRLRRLGLGLVGLALVLGGFRLLEGAMGGRLAQELLGAGTVAAWSTWMAFGAGILVTALLVPSQVAVGVAQSLLAAHALPPRLAVGWVSGLNIGTTADVLAASLALGWRGRGTALFHLGFNLVVAGMGLAAAAPLAAALRWGPPAQALARLHTGLNLGGALLVGPLVHPLWKGWLGLNPAPPAAGGPGRARRR